MTATQGADVTYRFECYFPSCPECGCPGGAPGSPCPDKTCASYEGEPELDAETMQINGVPAWAVYAWIYAREQAEEEA